MTEQSTVEIQQAEAAPAPAAAPETPKRPPGRPAAFPDQECEMLSVSIPISTKADLRAEAAISEETYNVIVNQAIADYIAERRSSRGV